MSIDHTCLYVRPNLPLLSAQTVADAIGAVSLLTMKLVAHPLSVFRNRLALQRIERFSVHRLRDIGFDRDWDGSLMREASVADFATTPAAMKGETK